jgi:hypothetical protein
MSIERNQGSSNKTIVENKGKVKSWSQLSYHLPEDIDPHVTNFVRGYFNAQLRLSEGKKTKAKRIFRGLDNSEGFTEFEENNPQLLAAIDIVVRGETNRSLMIEPSLKNIKD